MLDDLREHLDSSGLIPNGDTVVVGYSGGADSTALLVLLHELGIDVIGAHLHHGQRDEADEEAKRCQEFCESLDIPFVTGKADVPALARDRGMGLEEAGRSARYAFLAEAAYRLRAQWIATAHTEDDHLETILLNLARGTGLAGLAGIPQCRENIIRPLLIFSREQTRAFCDERKLWYHDDPANVDFHHSRTHIRHRVIPALEATHPGFRSAATRMSRIVQEEDTFLDGLAGNALSQCEVPLNGELAFLTQDIEFSVDRNPLLTYPLVVVRRAVRLGAQFLGERLDNHQTESLVHLLANDEKGALTTDGGNVVMEWTADRLHFRTLANDAPFKFPLTVPGETFADAFGWKITAQSAQGESPLRQPRSLDVIIDAGACEGGLHFRAIEPGDRITPIGLEGTKKVSDLVSEVGLTLAARRRLPMICDGVGPVWVPGAALSERVKVTAETRRPMRLTLASLKDS